MTTEHEDEARGNHPGLRARWDAELALVSQRPSDDPEVPAAWASIGFDSYQLFVAEGDESDLRLAEQALPEALAASPSDEEADQWHVLRVIHAHVLCCRRDLDVREGRGAAAPWDVVADTAVAGMAALDGKPEYAYAVALGRFLLALVARERWRENPGPDALAAALAAGEEALADLADRWEGTSEWVALHAGRAELLFARGRAGGVRADLVAAVEHQRAALSGVRDGPEQVPFRYDLAGMLVVLGMVGNDGDALRRARDELASAIDAATAAGVGAPSWWEWLEREVRVLDAYVRAVLWRDHGARDEVTIVAGRLDGLLAEPGAEDRISATFLEAFAHIRYERAAHDDDDAGRDAAIAMLRRAVARWQPGDGAVARAALLLGYVQLGRYHHDRNPERLAVIAEAARRVLDSEIEVPLARNIAQWMLVAVDSTLVVPENGDDPASLLEPLEGIEVTPLEEFVQEAWARGEVSFNDEEVTALERDLRGVRMDVGLMQRGFDLWRRTEPGSAEHGKLARSLLLAWSTVGQDGQQLSREQRDLLVEALVTADPDDLAPHDAHAVAGAALARHAMVDGDDQAWDVVLAHFDAASAAAPADEERHRRALEILRSLALYDRGWSRGGLDDLDASLGTMPGLLETLEAEGLTPATSRGARRELTTLQGMRAAHRGDLATADRALATLAEDLAGRDPQDNHRIEAYAAHEALRQARNVVAERLGAPLAPPPPGGPLPPAEVRRQAARLPRDHRARALGDVGMFRCVDPATEDPHSRADGLELLREALELLDEGSDRWTRYAAALAGVLCDPHPAEGGPNRRGSELDEGVALLERLRDRTGGPENRTWAGIVEILGLAYRMRAEEPGPARSDDRTGARSSLLSALRGFAWSALLQSRTEHVAEAVGRASEVARIAAAWCLDDDVPAEAVTALDSCRGLMLHAALTSRSVAERLVAAGQAELATEWRAAAPDPGGGAAVPSELRRRVLTQLTGSTPERPPRGRLLDPPSLADIGAALRELGQDALVYLVPALGPPPPPSGRPPERRPTAGPSPWGAAVVVTADGAARRVVLPRLAEDAEPLRAYAPVAGAHRDLGPVTGGGAAPESVSFRQQLDRLCRWAWDAAMRDVLAAFDPLRRERRRQPRLVLVPMGALAAVPWHAAWWPGGEGRRRYAFAEAEVSYAASARLLCEVAARPPVSHRGAALVVGDPTGDLRYAGVEAEAVHRAFYPDGTFLGGDAATPGRLAEWLSSPGGTGGVLHLACHATVTPLAAAGGRRHSAYLSLHGGEVSAETVAEASAAELEVVFLAACRSQVSGRGHDEAFSLSTAFLVAGAGSVVGSLWPVPDDATSVLMFLTHYFLRRKRLRPAQALRRAQQWMLDPQRRLPPGMPPELAARAARIDPDDLTAWAGFTHLGR
jgi:CHAT domain-containing protein